MLEYLCENYGLPNLDFIYWNQDGPWESIKGKVPVLVGCRALGVKNTILFNDWLCDIKNPEGPWNNDRKIIDQNRTPGQQKSIKHFGEGAAQIFGVEDSIQPQIGISMHGGGLVRCLFSTPI